MPIDLTNASTNIPDGLYFLDSSAIYGNIYTKISTDWEEAYKALYRSTNSKPKPAKKRTSLSLYREKLQQPK